MFMMIFAAELAAAAPAAQAQPADKLVGHSQHGDAGGHKEMDCCKHMKADKTAACGKGMPDAERRNAVPSARRATPRTTRSS